jgi:hypothetical protein
LYVSLFVSHFFKARCWNTEHVYMKGRGIRLVQIWSGFLARLYYC